MQESLTISVCNMKRVIKYLILAFAAGVIAVGCKDNFNELTDSDQRYIRFEFDSSNYFSNLLFEDGNGGFKMGAPFELLDSELLRITSYCYDIRDNALVAQKEILSSDGKNLAIEFDRLLKSRQYRFLFFADIVERDAELGYLELWYQLQVKNYYDFLLYRTSMQLVNITENLLLYSNVLLSPSNQVEEVNLSPITYNGYIRLVNADSFVYSSVCVNLVSQMSTPFDSGSYDVGVWMFDSNSYNITEYTTITSVKNKGDLKLEISYREASGGEKVEEFSVPMSNKPFTLQVDCKNGTYELCDSF